MRGGGLRLGWCDGCAAHPEVGEDPAAPADARLTPSQRRTISAFFGVDAVPSQRESRGNVVSHADDERHAR